MKIGINYSKQKKKKRKFMKMLYYFIFLVKLINTNGIQILS